jgi:hypothetical protein
MKAPYLEDKEFLRQFDLENKKEQYVRISVLDFKTETPIANLEGKSTGGSCNLSGTSSMRRTASCTVAVDPLGINGTQYHNITDINNLISMNKKVRIAIGFRNTLADIGYYTNQDIIWFPLGTYVIKAANISKNNSGINISLTLNDKCALLNGDMGGIIPAATVFSEQELYNATGTKREVEKILIKDIIKYLVIEFGGEDPNNIIITDIDDTIVKVMKWIGKTDVYLYEAPNNKKVKTKGPNEDDSSQEKGYYSKYTYGQDIGYTTEPFVYPGVLECKAGDAVSTILDKIKNTLGNFEWFYDIDGRFVFQKIKNYLNDSPTKDILKLDSSDYFPSEDKSISEYHFNRENKSLLTSVSSSPQFQNIKNDFIVWGTTKTTAGVEKPIRYRLAFENKPTISSRPRFMLIYKDYRGLQAALPLGTHNFKIAPAPSLVTDENKKYYYFNSSKLFGYDEELHLFREYPENTHKVCYVLPNPQDWRTELYYQGLTSDDKTFSKQPYFAELNSEWTKLCDLIGEETGSTNKYENISFPLYKSKMRDIPISSYEYWLDFVEGSPFNVHNIGRRTKVVSDKATNCIYPSEIPNYIYILADGDGERVNKEINAANNLNREAILVSQEIYNNLTLGGSKSSAYDKIRELLYLHTTYNETVSLSVVPIYYLEPNTRITIFDNEVGVNGDYMIKSISLPLTPNGTSNISATKCLDKTF